MLVDGREVLAWAEQRRCAAGSFNTYNLETTRAIITAAEAESAPIFLAVGAGALQYAGFELLHALCAEAARRATVPVALHLDHADDLTMLTNAHRAGFSSFMIDGSALAFEDNVALVRQARALVDDVALEAELGGVGGSEDRSGDQSSAIPLTDPVEAAAFVEQSGVDSLAVAIGNAHGVYRGEPRIDLDRLSAIAATLDVPIVLHGASGIPAAIIGGCVERGVRKINVNTEIRRALFESLGRGVATDAGKFDLPGLFTPAMVAMAGVVSSHIRLFRDGG